MKLYEVPVIAGGLLAAASVGLVVGCTTNPPVKIGPIRTSTTIPSKPVPTDKPISVRVCISGQRCMIWLDRTGTYYIHGPYDPYYGPPLCGFRPDLGDTYYSEASGQVLTPPAACPA